MPAPTIQTILDLDPVDLPFSEFFRGASLDLIAAERAVFDNVHVDYGNAKVRLAIQSHVMRAGGAIILVDACIGEDKERPLRPHWHKRTGKHYLKNLAAAGFEPEDIDFVFCTHLHADHVGWNTRLDNGRWIPTFPNARYLVEGGELAFWMAAAAKDPGLNHGSYRDSILPIIEADRYTRVAPGARFVDGATILPLPGHTPGQIGLELANADGPNVILCGDAIHSPVQISHPELATFVCEDVSQAIATREKLIERVIDDNIVLMPAHLRKAPALRARRKGAGYAPVFCDCHGAEF